MRRSGEKPAAAILGTGSDFWLGGVPCLQLYEISRACQRTPPSPHPRSPGDPLRLFRLAGWGVAVAGREVQR